MSCSWCCFSWLYKERSHFTWAKHVQMATLYLLCLTLQWNLIIMNLFIMESWLYKFFRFQLCMWINVPKNYWILWTKYNIISFAPVKYFGYIGVCTYLKIEVPCSMLASFRFTASSFSFSDLLFKNGFSIGVENKIALINDSNLLDILLDCVIWTWESHILSIWTVLRTYLCM